MLKLCEYFGGLSIKVPTIEELESVVYSLVLYQYVQIDGISYEEAVKLLGSKSSELRKIKSDYEQIKVILDSYDFTRR